MVFKVSADFVVARDADIHGHLLTNGASATIPTFLITQLTAFWTSSAISFALNINKLAV
ncbi:MAG: hypothetical protein ABI618_19225 [Nitrospirota bacterium]